MLVKTEFCETLKKARIVLRYRLQTTYYRHNGTLDLPRIAKDLRDVEYSHVNPDGSVDMVLSAVTPIPTAELDMEKEWLVVELTGYEKSLEATWIKFLEENTARIMDAVTPAINKPRVATVEYGLGKRFVIMDDTTGAYDESDYITVD